MPRPLGQQQRSLEARHAVAASLPPKRPSPPSELDDDAAKVWKQIVGAMPPLHFTGETFCVLICLVETIVIAKKINLEIKQSLTDPKVTKLINLKIRLDSAIAMLASKLRLTPSSQYDSSRANTKADKSNRSTRPWEFGKPNDAADQLLS